jgi:hypothetical protein
MVNVISTYPLVRLGSMLACQWRKPVNPAANNVLIAYWASLTVPWNLNVTDVFRSSMAYCNACDSISDVTSGLLSSLSIPVSFAMRLNPLSDVFGNKLARVCAKSVLATGKPL